MPISHEHKAVFVHIPKTGGTSIEHAFNIFGDWSVEDENLLFGNVKSPALLEKGWLSGFLQHLTRQEIRELLPVGIDQEYFYFGWVRNPWDRMVSVFSNKDIHMVRSARAVGLDLLSMDFETFVAATLDFSHAHLRSQYEFLCTPGNPAPAVDFVGRFESMQDDFSRLCGLLRANLSLGHHNYSQHRPYREYYTSISRDIVARRYAQDIDIFGYSF